MKQLETSNVDDALDIQQMKSQANQAANWLKVIAHPERLLVLCQLVKGEVGVGELMAMSELSQSAFSQHLAILRQHELVTTRKSAQQVYYSLADSRVTQLIQLLHSEFCHSQAK